MQTIIGRPRQKPPAARPRKGGNPRGQTVQPLAHPTWLVELAEIFDTTVDYLLTGNRTDERPLHNLRLLERFRAFEEFKAEEQEALITFMDAMIIKNKVEGAIKTYEKKAS